MLQPRSLRLDGKYPDDAAAARAALIAADLDVMVVAAYGLILPQWVLDLPRRGCLNVHGSLLPRWRGAAPIHRAIEAGDTETGITIMQMDAGLDTGAMLLTQAEPIRADDSTGRLHDRMAALGGRLIVQALADPSAWRPRAQPAEGATYASKVDKAEAALDLQQPAALIERRIRAFDPFPGATLKLAGEPWKLWRAALLLPDGAAQRPPGQLWQPAPGRLALACGEGALELLELQPPGGKRLPTAAVLQGRVLPQQAG